MTETPEIGEATQPSDGSESYQVKLEQFEGPLDLLLFLIKQEQINIYDIPIARITEQYLSYLDRIPLSDLDSAGEFLLMAATLMRIKARMLLPSTAEGDEADEDPRKELVDRLLEYQKFKEVAARLRGMEAERSLHFARGLREQPPEGDDPPELEPATLFDLMRAFSRVLVRARHYETFRVELEDYSVEDRRAKILARLDQGPRVLLEDLFDERATRLNVIVTLIALLELIRTRQVEVGQTRRFGEIWIEKRIGS